MRKFLLLLACGLGTASCIDKDYDFGKLSTDNISIGDENSRFRIPLARIKVGTNEISGGDSDLSTFFNEADIWLCDPLPGYAESIDIKRIKDDEDYFEALAQGLLDQMKIDDAKMDAVTSLIYDKYRHEFDIPGLPTEADNKQAYQNAFKTIFRADTPIVHDQLTAKVRETSRQYLSDLEHIKTMQYSIGRIDIDRDMLDMIIGKAEADDTVVTLYGTIESYLPAKLHINPAFANTSVTFTLGVEPGRKNAFKEVNISKRDLEQIVEAAEIDLPIVLEAYVPRTFDASRACQLELQLSMCKTGGLNIDL